MKFVPPQMQELTLEFGRLRKVHGFAVHRAPVDHFRVGAAECLPLLDVVALEERLRSIFRPLPIVVIMH